jgi:hypothetical protein
MQDPNRSVVNGLVFIVRVFPNNCKGRPRKSELEKIDKMAKLDNLMFDNQLQYNGGQKPQADNRVYVKKRLVNTRQILGVHK